MWGVGLLTSRRKIILAAILVSALVLAFCLPTGSALSPTSATYIPPGFLQHETDEPLLPANPPVRRHDVYELKIRLQQLGYYKGKMDDAYDTPTIDAVKRFQKDNWLEPNGIVDVHTWNALAEGVPRKEALVSGLTTAKGEIELIVDTERAALMVIVDGQLWKTYPVAVGKWITPTPYGEWRIVDKGYSPGGALGTRWMALDVPWGTYGIHGTNRPWSIGYAVSSGCVRLYNEDVEELFDLVKLGTLVRVIGYKPAVQFGSSVSPGETGPHVVLLQDALRKRGFSPGRLDGRFGENTSRAVEEIKELFGLGSGGAASRDVLEVLGLLKTTK